MSRRRVTTVFMKNAAIAVRLGGRLLSIDPALGTNSNIGWALFEEGELITSGELTVSSKKIGKKLVEIKDKVSALCELYQPRVMVIEKLRGRILHIHLIWACGAIVAGGDTVQKFFEVDIQSWRRLIPEGYVKTDQGDAIWIGRAVYHFGNIEEQAIESDTPKKAKATRARRKKVTRKNK